MVKFSRFEEIEAWQQGCKLAVDIYELTKKGDFTKDYGLKDQIRRSAVSIPSNISEGFERGTVKEFIRFLHIAKGSAGELRTQSYIAKTLNYINTEEFNDLIDRAKHLSAMIANLIKYLKQRR